MTLLLALTFAVMGTTLLVRAVMLPRTATNQGIARIADYGMHAAPVPTQVKAARDSAARRLLERYSPRGYEAALRQRFMRAGQYDVSAERMLLFRFGAPALVVVLALIMAVQGLDAVRLLMLAAMFGIAFRAPDFVLSRRMKARAYQVDREIPDFIELLAITVEAGIGFEAAVQASIARMEGPVREELALMLQEVRMGVSRDDAMQHVVDRIDSRNLRVWVRSLVQGNALGVPLGQILRNLSVDMRIRRRQAAEERAQKAPVKMTFPTVFLIFPALLTVILGPAAFRIVELFSK